MSLYPDLFIAGFNRAGTSTLHALLSHHPDLVMSQPKELHFFNYDANYKTGRSFYDKAFAYKPEAGLKGEATPSYIYKSVMFGMNKQDYKWAPEDDSIIRMARECPEAKIIVSLRHPIKTAYSNFNKAQVQGREPDSISFEQAMKEEIAGKRSPKDTFLCHYYLTSYSLHIEHLLNHFPKDNVLFLVFEKWTQDQAETYRRISEFLGLDATIPPDFQPVLANPGKQSRYKRIQDIFRKFLPERIVLPIFLRFMTRQGYDPLSPAVIKDLQSHYVEDVRRLENMTGLDLSCWDIRD